MSTSCYIYFHCSYLYNYYNYFEPCALNSEFQHFIPRFNQNFLNLWIPLKEGIGGESRGDRAETEGDFRGNSIVKQNIFSLLQLRIEVLNENENENEIFFTLTGYVSIYLG